MADAEKAADIPLPWSLAALGSGDPRVVEQAQAEARELALALAAQSVALAEDAGPEELADRLDTVSRNIWPADPLEGYGLHSSLGTFLVARVAMSWAPPTKSTLRDAPLDATEVAGALVELGLTAARARLLVSGYSEPPADFQPRKGGLEAALLAGLAEQTLSQTEKRRALAQVAYSPRCLARLGAVCLALDGVRNVLPVIPVGAESLGAEYISAIAALALGRPDRAMALLGSEPESPTHRTLAELAHTEWSLRQGLQAKLQPDETLPLIASDGDLPPAAPHHGEAEGDEDDEDDVLSIEEEVVQADGDVDVGAHTSTLPAPPTWSRPSWPEIELDDTFVRLWREARRKHRTLFGHLGGLLGLKAAEFTPLVALPPDERTIRRILDERSEGVDVSNAETERLDIASYMADQQEKLGLSSVEPLFPVVRATLRAIVAASKGQPPSEASVDAAGDASWALRRARALGLTVRGDVAEAIRTLHTAADHASEEARFAQARRMRFAERPAEPVEPAEARRRAAHLVSALSVRLGRTIAGTS